MQLTPEELAKRAGALGQQPGVIYGRPDRPGSTTPPPPSSTPKPTVRVPELDQNPDQQWRSRGNAALNRAAQFDADTASRLANERAARLDAFNKGGIDALNQTVSAQENPAFRRTPDAPGGPPQQANAPRAPAAPATPRAGAPSVARSTLGALGNTAREAATPRLVNPATVGSKLNQVFSKAGGSAIGSTIASAGILSDLYAGGEERDRYLKSVGAEDAGVLGTLGADTVRALAETGNAIGFGIPRRLGAGLSNAFNGDGFVDGFLYPDGKPAAEAGAPAAPSARPAPATAPATTPASGSPSAPGSNAGDSTAPANDPVVAEIQSENGTKRTFTRSQIEAMNSAVNTAPSSQVASMIAGGGAGGALGAMPPPPAPADFRGNDRSNRLSTQRGAEKRLEGLYAQYNDLMSRGRRRNAAVVADLIGKELGVVQGLAGTQTMQGQQPQGTSPQDIAEMGRIQALTEGAQMDNQAKRLAQQALVDMLDESKTPEERAAAQQRYLAMRGDSQRQAAPIFKSVMNDKGGEDLVYIDPSNPTRGQPVSIGGAAGGAADLNALVQNGQGRWVRGPNGEQLFQPAQQE